jgi:hypothetical protein
MLYYKCISRYLLVNSFTQDIRKFLIKKQTIKTKLYTTYEIIIRN